MLCEGVKSICSRVHILSQPPRRATSSPIKSAAVRLCSRPFSVQMSAAVSPNNGPAQFIEHVVLFKVRPDLDPSKPAAMVSNLGGLASLDPVLHLSAGPLLRTRSSSLAFTHMLHARYASKSGLDDYNTHPAHVTVVNDYVKPIIEDVMAVDWVSSAAGPVVIPPGSAMRVTFLKLKENLEENGKDEVLGVVGGIREKFTAIEQLSFGENFSPTRAKGFSIGSIVVF